MCCTRLAGNTGREMMQRSPSAHHRTTLSGYIFATKARIDNGKNLLNRNISPYALQYGELWLTSGWDRFVNLGHPRKFQQVSCLGLVTAATSFTEGQPNFARCLAFSWAATLYIHLRGSCPWWNFATCKIHFTSKSCVLLYWQLVTARHSSSGRQPNCGMVQGMELPNFRRARHLYSAGRPSRWASAHILVLVWFRGAD